MSGVGDDIKKQFEDFAKRTHSVLRKFPLIAANEGKNFFQDRFNAQNWIDRSTQPWKKRKPNSKRNNGRAILTDTGRGKRSIRIIKAAWGDVEVGITDPVVQKYMGAHNNGFRSTVTVQRHSRIASRKVATRYNKSGKASKSGMKKIRGKGHEVKSHQRKMNIPKRRFIGNSEALNIRINRQFIYQLNTI